MMRGRFDSIALLLLLVAISRQAGAQNATLDDVRADFAKQDYRSALTKANQVLNSWRNEPPPGDKYELLMTRAECQLQLKDRLGSSTSFKSAAKCAADVNQLALAKANALIVEKSAMGKYTPRMGGTKDAIDIVPIDSRKQAMLAMKDDLWSQNKSQLDAALKATTLPPIEKVFTPLSDMFFLETAATGQANDSGQVMRDLGQHAYDLMQGEVSRNAGRVEQLNLSANSSDYDGSWGGARRGLSSPERDELKSCGTYLAKLRDRATEYRGIASKLGGNEQRWNNMVLDANDALNTAEGLAKAP
jgi:hypothetical protein